MEIFYDVQPGLLTRSAIALGFFDGVHHGHQVVIKKAVDEARHVGATAGVVTFRDHPRALTLGAHPLLLTVIEQRLELFAALGVEATLVLTFSEDLCKLSPREYVESVLVNGMGARSISVGYNHHFGRDREGNPDLLRQMGSTMGFDVHVAPMVYVEEMEVSSSRIRELISRGEMEQAAKVLSRPYTILGVVIEGAGRGRKIGFPTANLKVRSFQMLPATGVHAGRVKKENGENLKAVINVGVRPTFQTAASDEPLQPLVEVHVLDFEGDLYGTTMQVEFLKYLRAEQKFDGIEALKRQILIDCEHARAYLSGQRHSSASNVEPEQKLPA